MLAAVLASLPFAETPGVNTPLSPAELNAAMSLAAFLIALMSFPAKAALAWAIVVPPEGDDPKAALLRMAATSCCSSCILAWSSWLRLIPVDVLEMLAQKAPISLPSSVILWVPMVVFATPANVFPPAVPPNQTACVRLRWVAQKPWVRVVRGASFKKVKVTVSPAARVVLAVIAPRFVDTVDVPRAEAPMSVSIHPVSEFSVTE